MQEHPKTLAVGEPHLGDIYFYRVTPVSQEEKSTEFPVSSDSPDEGRKISDV